MLGPPEAAEFVNEIEIDLLLPTATLPKSNVELLTLRLAGFVPELLLGEAVPPPPQEAARSVERIATNRVLRLRHTEIHS